MIFESIRDGMGLQAAIGLYGSEIVEAALREGLDIEHRKVRCAEMVMSSAQLSTYRIMVKDLRS